MNFQKRHNKHCNVDKFAQQNYKHEKFKENKILAFLCVNDESRFFSRMPTVYSIHFYYLNRD